jgi:CSLREA domain-containing protein
MQEKRSTKRPYLSFVPVRLGLVLALLAMALSVQPAPVARAATITVTTTSDELNSDGDCSLREAIQAANTNAAVDHCTAGQATPHLDTITFAAVTNGIPIVLAGAAGENANTSGDLDVLDSGDLTIQGNGAANTIVDGGGSDRVFHICPGGGCDNDVTISGVTIRNGLVTLSGGGGIRNEAGTTTLDDSAVIANTAVNGGGIANFAILHIQNGSTIGELGAGNWAYLGSGGGIYNYAGTTTVDGSTVISNTRSTMAAASGTRPR